jgi:hypothetical protein
MALTNVDLDRIDGNSGSLANVSTSALNGGPLAGTRNRIINGDMRIDQRNAGAAVTVNTNPVWSVDRWYGGKNGTINSFTLQRSTTAPTGFSNSLLVTAGTGVTPASSDFGFVSQPVEGFNFADFGWGAAGAQSATISFWVRSSLTGSFGVGLRNGAANRSYIASYAINAANTWEYKTITVPGDTTGTWATDNTLAVGIFFDVGNGTQFGGAAGSWSSANLLGGLNGGVKLAATTGATLHLTGVQLEAGTVATPFERRSYGQELALCQRYYYRVVSNVADNNYARLSIFGQCASSTTAFAEVLFPVSMRTNPTSLQTTGTANNYSLFNSAGSGVVATALAFNAGSAHSGEVLVTVASGLVAGNATVLIANNNTTAYLGWSAEL